MLQFNPVLVAEWVGQLHEAKFGGSSNRVVTTASEFGISTTRVIQFLNLLRTVDLRVRSGDARPDRSQTEADDPEEPGKDKGVTQRLPQGNKVKDI